MNNSARSISILSLSSWSFIVLKILLNIAPLGFLLGADAALSCDSDSFCQQILNRTESVCLPSGTCSNPFQQGCLKTIGIQQYNGRVCNSDDDNDSYQFCKKPEFNYPELRIHQTNWESGIFMAWIYQILLSEVLKTPATVGISALDSQHTSFYSRSNTIEYSSIAYPWDAIRRANDPEEDCTTTQDPCVHMLPDVWSGQYKQWQELLRENVIEPVTGNGAIGKWNMVIPAFTARRFTSFVSYYGLQGEKNRYMLAKVFKRPQTWIDYCEQVSSTNCSSTDHVAARFPTPDEEKLYFSEGKYAGYFSANDKNNCNNNPKSCTGHVILPPCSWSSSAVAQLYWNGIVGLEGDGPNTITGQYEYGSMMQIWRAANATKSDIVMFWWTPHQLVEEFYATDAEFQPIFLPVPSDECKKHRTSDEEKCSANATERVGDPIGACDDEAHATQRVIAKWVVDDTYNQSETTRSPAYQFLKNMKVDELQMNTILRDWVMKGVDPYGNDAREAVCGWVAKNLDSIIDYVPRGYPKRLKTMSRYNEWFLILAKAFGAFTSITAVGALGLLYRRRKTKVMVYAQPYFLLLILVGFFLTTIGAIFFASEPTKFSCTSRVWLTVLGMTVELVPVLVKTSAINKVIQSSKKSQQRVSMTPSYLMRQVVGAVVLVMTFLICWTVIDVPHRAESLVLSKKDPKIVEVSLKCTSKYWWYAFWINCGWLYLLLGMAAILAFQSREIMPQFNESQSLATMVYSHFLFMLLRLICVFFASSEIFPHTICATLISLTFSLDAFFAMAIYLLPKLIEAQKAPKDWRSQSQVDLLSSFTRMNPSEHKNSNKDGQKGELNILVCSANMGNAEPTMESMLSWIPTGGNCDSITPLEGQSFCGSRKFDLIVIGMQEATWKEKATTTWKGKKQRKVDNEIRGEEISTGEVLNALEEHDTATLRDMLNQVLGLDYLRVAEEQRGQMRLYIFASTVVADDIDHVKICGANTGVANVLANKGGIVVTLDYKKTRITFLSAHLAAHEGNSYYKSRCDNIRSILKEAKTFRQNKLLDVAVTSHHMFVLGDLNFRTVFDTREKGNIKHNNSINDMEVSANKENFHRAMNLIEAKDFQGLYAFDELQKGIRAGDLLADFKTLACDFSPTFKLERGEGFVYKDQRIPSYTDRILFKSADSFANNFRSIAYESCVDFVTSDHKPIRGAFSILPNQNNSSDNSKFLQENARFVFHSLQCSDLPTNNIISEGMIHPYLMIMSDSEQSAGWRRSSTPLGKLKNLLLPSETWPRTKLTSNTNNPAWLDEEVTFTMQAGTFSLDTMLFITVMGFNPATRSDEFLCALPLRIKDLVSKVEEGVSTHLVIERPLHRHGQFAGQVKFEVEVDSMKRRPTLAHLISRKSISSPLRRSNVGELSGINYKDMNCSDINSGDIMEFMHDIDETREATDC